MSQRKDARPQPGSFSSSEYNEVAMAAKLGGIRLLKLDFDVQPEAFDEEMALKLAYDREAIACNFDPSDGSVAAIFRYAVNGKGGRKRLLHCQAEFAVMYATGPNFKPAAAEAFCLNTGVFAAYPYFRALASQTAWNSGIMLPPLPAIASVAHIPKKKPADLVDEPASD